MIVFDRYPDGVSPDDCEPDEPDPDPDRHYERKIEQQIEDEPADEDEPKMACERHGVERLPSGYDRCPYCEQERDREAQIRHEMTRDPTLEPW